MADTLVIADRKRALPHNKTMKTFLLGLIILASSLTISGQTGHASSIVHDVHLIESNVLGEKRRILVHLPESYNRFQRKYPVVYMLDGHSPHPEMMAGILANQTWGNVMPQMILVSIENTDRTRDMTPTHVARFPTSGGANKFLDYIEKEVIPLVEKSYRVEPYRIFAGHSFAGLAVVYSLVTRPDLFDAYIAASPYLQWDDKLVVRQFGEKFANTKLEKTVFLGLGNEPEYEDAWDDFQSLLKKAKPKGFDYEFRQFKEDNHSSGVLPSYYFGLRKIFSGWAPDERLTISGLESHYRGLSKRFGYTIRIPEELLNISAYTLLRKEQFLEALDLFKKNTEYYPDSANVYDSLGECYEKMGRKKDAQLNYKKAFELAAAQGNTLLARSAKANYERVSKN